MIRLVLSDLDSTLVWGERHVITRHALDAIHTLRQAGVYFAPATGRIYADLPWMFDGDDQACSTAVTKILPSPITPVLAAAAIVSIASWTSWSWTTAITITLGTRATW